jgi:hypothetical protein
MAFTQLYLVIYNYFLSVINRHLHLHTVKYNVVWVDDESENAKSLDNLFEFYL